MDRMKYLVFAIIILCANNTTSQTIYANLPLEREILLPPQGFGIELLNSKGNSGIFNNVSNIGKINPASIYHLQNLSIGFSYQFQSSIDSAWFAGTGTSRVQNFLPQSFGAILHYDNLSFGIGFGQKYNGSVDFDPIPITTVTEPDGTGEYFYPEFENSLQSYTFSTAYQFKEIIFENSNLSFGLKYLLNRLSSYESIGNVSASASAFGSNFEIGACFEIKTNTQQIINIGISYTSGTGIRGGVEYEGTRTLIPGSVPGDSLRYQIISQPYNLSLEVPSELSFDIFFNLNKKIGLSGRINNKFWEDVSDNSNNQLELSTNTVYSFTPSTNASLGLFYTNKSYAEDYFNINAELYAFYITAGVSFRISFINLDLAVADSHLFSGDRLKQTIGKIGLGIQL